MACYSTLPAHYLLTGPTPALPGPTPAPAPPPAPAPAPGRAGPPGPAAPVASLPAAQVFLALGEPTRWAIVHYLLAREQAFAGELQRVVGRKSSTASRHLQVLHELGVTRRVMDAGEDERRVCYAIRPEWRVPGEPRTLEFGTVRVRFAAPAARRPPGAGTARRAV